MQNAFIGLSIVAGFLSGGLWLYAACIKVPTNLSGGFGGTVEGLDEMRSGFSRQANWNSAAAISTGTAALSQGIALLLARQAQGQKRRGPRLALSSGRGICTRRNR